MKIPTRRARTAALLAPVMAVGGMGIALASAASATSGNLAVNPGFEQGTTGWFVATGTSLTLGAGHTGVRSGTVTNTSGAAKTVALNDQKNTVASTSKGHVYEASVWVRAPKPKVSAGIRLMEYAGSTLHGQDKGTVWLTDTAWHKVSVKYTAATSGSSIDVNVLAWSLPAGWQLQADDVSVVDTTSATTPGPTATTTAAPKPTTSTTAPAPTTTTTTAKPAPTTTTTTTTAPAPTTTTTTTTAPAPTTTTTTTAPAPTTTVPAPSGWKLAWSDEFNGSTLDSATWNVENNSTYGEGNLEMACLMNRPQNVSVQGGYLSLTARRETTPIKCGNNDSRFPNGRDYTSGHITTKGKKAFTYGRFEIRAKLPTSKGDSKGLWPAFWLRPETGSVGELDVMEAIGSNATGTEYNKLHQTIHYDYNGTYPRAGFDATMPSGLPSDGWHTYTTEWEKGAIRWYVDGVLTFQRTAATTPWIDDAFNRPFYMRLNLSVGGRWPGAPEDTTKMPSSYDIDYVRVYQR
ncbi:family 16 glycosylhydrolase [Angustibacter peucedani]